MSNRNFGLETQKGAGKGDKTRVTDVRIYRENFAAINWSPKPTAPAPLKEEAEHDWRMGL